MNELSQEFHYAHPSTKVKINNIFNTHFYGSQLWDLFSVEAIRLEKTWNISQRIMLGIPRNKHRFFIEPLTEIQHIKFSLLKRFVNFVNSIESSKKSVMRNMLKIVTQDCRTTTGRNLRKLMLVLEKRNVDKISKVDLKNQIYDSIPSGHKWKVCIAKEIVQIKNNELETEYLKNNELETEYLKNNELETKYLKNNELETKYLKNNELETKYLKNNELETKYLKNNELETKYLKNNELETKYLKNNELETKYLNWKKFFTLS